MLGCLRTAGKCQYWICLCNCFCRRSNDARGRATANAGCAITQHSLSVEKAELETPGFEFCTLFSLKSSGDLQRFWGGWTKTWSKETLLRKLWQTATRPKNAVLALAQLLLYSSSFLSGILCCTKTSLCYSSSWWKHLFSEQVVYCNSILCRLDSLKQFCMCMFPVLPESGVDFKVLSGLSDVLLQSPLSYCWTHLFLSPKEKLLGDGLLMWNQVSTSQRGSVVPTCGRSFFPWYCACALAQAAAQLTVNIFSGTMKGSNV